MGIERAYFCFVRDIKEDPETEKWKKKYTFKSLSYYGQPEGEGCGEKMMLVCGKMLYIGSSMAFISLLLYRRPKNFGEGLVRYLKFTVPAVSAGFAFTATSCIMCSKRGVNDHLNWTVGGALAGAVPGIHYRKPLALALGIPLGALFAWANYTWDPRFFFHHWPSLGGQMYVPTRVHSWTLPNERLSLDLVPGGRGQEMPLHYLGEKWDDRVLMNKQKYGYLEAELDQMSEIEEKIRNRRT